MANIKNYNFNKLDLKLSNSDYWDFFLSTDNSNPCVSDCDAVWFDFNRDIFVTSGSFDNIKSLNTWPDAVNTGFTLNTIGLTGLDNGLITFDKTSGDTANLTLLNKLTGSTLTFTSGDTKFKMNKVTGTTGNFIYPIDLIIDTTSVGNFIRLNGGFYQGYYKLDGYDYEVLPTRTEEAWAATFWINKESSNTNISNTLNNLYPENKGLFFYMGTRAENKFWSQFSGNSKGCASDCIIESACTETLGSWCTTPKETDVVIEGEYGIGIPLSPPAVKIDLIKNQFLIYGRAKGGASNHCGQCGGNHDGLGIYNTCTYDGKGIPVATFKTEITNTTNPFLIYGRAKSGASNHCGQCGGNHDGFGIYNTCTFSGFTSLQKSINYKIDIIDNALGFRIKDDGSIGYRLLTVTGVCINDIYTSGYTIHESYSVSGAVKSDKWSNIVIRFVADNKLTHCELLIHKARKGKLKIYVDGNLQLVVNEFDEFIARRLDEFKDKQLGVPFNFSLGGGSQGLLESQTFDGQDPSDIGLPIERNFAGTFIGDISQFKFFTCDISFPTIRDNYNKELPRYRLTDSNRILCEDFTYLTTENDFRLLWK